MKTVFKVNVEGDGWDVVMRMRRSGMKRYGRVMEGVLEGQVVRVFLINVICPKTRVGDIWVDEDEGTDWELVERGFALKLKDRRVPQVLIFRKKGE